LVGDVDGWGILLEGVRMDNNNELRIKDKE